MANAGIEKAVRNAIQHYIAALDDEAEPGGIYRLILNEVEGAVIRAVLEYHNDNQSKTARWLGITRNTLKKKMREHALCDKS